MVHRNESFNQFQSSYLFVEIANRKEKFLQLNPTANLISLGIGDTTEPIPAPVIERLKNKVLELSHPDTYTGYPPFNGTELLRQLIAETFYKGRGISADEIFISDGSKPDLARLQLLFDRNTTVTVQDPVYPAYVDGTVLSGKGGVFEEGRYSKIAYMPCTPENDFFPDLSKVPRTDLIFFCSPNNPTGAVATKEQLKALVAFAKKNNSIIIFDSAYSGFIRDETLPRSIYEIEGALEVAFETSSFSKMIGFTGVRLGWTVCPKTLKFDDGKLMHTDWARIMGTCFNGASNIAEQGGIATLQPEGLKAMKEITAFYMENATIIRNAMEKIGYECYGGRNCPYIWIRVPNRDSWSVFQEWLDIAHVVVTPGSGFGMTGENFIRISAFAHRMHVEEAVLRLVKAFTGKVLN